MLLPVYRYFKKIAIYCDHICTWKSKGLSAESIKPLAASNNSLAPASNHINTKSRVIFDGHCLKQAKVTFTHNQKVNSYIVYEINLWSYIQGAGFVWKSFIWCC